MDDSIRLQILKAIETKLLTITKDNGYNHDLNIENCTYGYVPPNMTRTYPLVCLLPGIELVRPLVSDEYSSGSAPNSMDGWPIYIIAYVQTDKQEKALRDEMEQMIQDIVICILSDHTLGLPNYVNNCYLIDIDSIPDLEQATGTLMCTFNVKYDFPKGTP
jgi:hypothetical protein